MSERNFQDEFDQLQLGQLHAVVLQLSKNCFEIKKICLTVLVSSMVLIASFTEKRLDFSLFIGAILVIGFFYILDAQSYFYQEKIRVRIAEISNAMWHRNTPQLDISGFGIPLSEARIRANRLRRAFFNASMWFYGALLLIDIAVLALYVGGLIQSPVRG